MATRTITEHTETTASSFLDRLCAHRDEWHPDASGRQEWVFRGHGDATWRLHPRAIREPSMFARHGVHHDARHVPSSIPALDREHLIEQLLVDFREGLNRSGLPVPMRQVRVRGWEGNAIHSGGEPALESFPLMALAQHHGLPTLFLDWTRRAWFAAYHAAVVAAERGASASHLCVWAVLRRDEGDDFGPRFVEAPGSSNANLRAQRGLFSILTTDTDVSLEDYYSGSTPDRSPIVDLRKIQLPTAEAPKLLRLLSYEGISAESMYPGADGIVRAMKERALWDRPR